MKNKKKLTKEQIYKRNQKKEKIIRILAPIVFWGCLVGAIICLIYAIKNSFGNVSEMIGLLDSKKYTGEQLQANYIMLIKKYGEWVIGTGSTGFTIKFINVGKVIFNGFMLLNFFGCIILGVCSVLLGKFILPKWAERIRQNNQDMVNLVILKNDKE